MDQTTQPQPRLAPKWKQPCGQCARCMTVTGQPPTAPGDCYADFLNRESAKAAQ